MTSNYRGFTYQTYPLARGKVLVRLENLLDRFDATNSETKFVDLMDLSRQLWVKG